MPENLLVLSREYGNISFCLGLVGTLGIYYKGMMFPCSLLRTSKEVAVSKILGSQGVGFRAHRTQQLELSYGRSVCEYYETEAVSTGLLKGSSFGSSRSRVVVIAG